MNDDALIQQALALIAHIRSRHITFCAGSQKLEHLLKSLIFCRRNVPGGIYMEAGVAMGGSAMLIALLKPVAATLALYDVFDLLPPPSAEDGQKAQNVYSQFLQGNVQDVTSQTYLAHTHDMLPFVKQNMAEAGLDPEALHVEFHKGLFADTMRISEPVAFCHIDCDWYEPAKFCIEQIREHMAPQGLVVFDDYHSFEGCQKAVDEWLAADARYRIASKEWSIVVQRIA